MANKPPGSGEYAQAIATVSSIPAPPSSLPAPPPLPTEMPSGESSMVQYIGSLLSDHIRKLEGQLTNVDRMRAELATLKRMLEASHAPITPPSKASTEHKR